VFLYFFIFTLTNFADFFLRLAGYRQHFFDKRLGITDFHIAPRLRVKSHSLSFHVTTSIRFFFTTRILSRSFCTRRTLSTFFFVRRTKISLCTRRTKSSFCTRRTKSSFFTRKSILDKFFLVLSFFLDKYFRTIFNRSFSTHFTSHRLRLRIRLLGLYARPGASSRTFTCLLGSFPR